MEKMKLYAVLMLLVQMTFAGCGGFEDAIEKQQQGERNNQESASQNGTNSQDLEIALKSKDLPECNRGHFGKTYYVVETESFLYCDQKDWTPIDLSGKTGEKGDQGEQGLQGESGEKGDQGDQGPKGDRGEQGLKGDQGNQGLQGIQGQTGASGSNGSNGSNGTNGTNGFNALVEMQDEDPGQNCEFGGFQFVVGLDLNRNGSLETSEITDSEFLCHVNVSTVDPVEPPENVLFYSLVRRRLTQYDFQDRVDIVPFDNNGQMLAPIVTDLDDKHKEISVDIAGDRFFSTNRHYRTTMVDLNGTVTDIEPDGNISWPSGSVFDSRRQRLITSGRLTWNFYSPATDTWSETAANSFEYESMTYDAVNDQVFAIDSSYRSRISVFAAEDMSSLRTLTLSQAIDFAYTDFINLHFANGEIYLIRQRPAMDVNNQYVYELSLYKINPVTGTVILIN